MNTAILPPIGYRVPVGRHWFVKRKETAALKFKAAVSYRRVDRTAGRRLFFFAAVRQLPFLLLLTGYSISL